MNCSRRWFPVLRGLILVTTVSVAAPESAGAAEKAQTPQALKAEIEALKADKVAWREVQWKSCLLKGLKESREKKKPMLLWVFIDRPVDDRRC